MLGCWVEQVNRARTLDLWLSLRRSSRDDGSASRHGGSGKGLYARRRSNLGHLIFLCSCTVPRESITCISKSVEK
jgi:hypothetical protein